MRSATSSSISLEGGSRPPVTKVCRSWIANGQGSPVGKRPLGRGVSPTGTVDDGERIVERVASLRGLPGRQGIQAEVEQDRQLVVAERTGLGQALRRAFVLAKAHQRPPEGLQPEFVVVCDVTFPFFSTQVYSRFASSVRPFTQRASPCSVRHQWSFGSRSTAAASRQGFLVDTDHQQ